MSSILSIHPLEAVETHSGTPEAIAATAIATARDTAKWIWTNTPTEQILDPYRVAAAVRQIRSELMKNTLLGPMEQHSGREMSKFQKMQRDFLKNNPEKVARWIKSYQERVQKIASGN